MSGRWGRTFRLRTGSAPFRVVLERRENGVNVPTVDEAGKVLIRYVKSKVETYQHPSKFVPYDGGDDRGDHRVDHRVDHRGDDPRVTPSNTLDEITKSVLKNMTREELRKDETMKEKLYQVIGEDNLYGNFLTKDSTGRYVLEMKGSGAVRAFEKDKVSEVLPYTVDVVFGEGESAYSYYATAGEVEVGQLIMLSDTADYVAVVAVDTKSRKANKWLEGWVVSNKRLTAGD